jgi:hypothetical protein
MRTGGSIFQTTFTVFSSGSNPYEAATKLEDAPREPYPEGQAWQSGEMGVPLPRNRRFVPPNTRSARPRVTGQLQEKRMAHKCKVHQLFRITHPNFSDTRAGSSGVYEVTRLMRTIRPAKSRTASNRPASVSAPCVKARSRLRRHAYDQR